MILVVDPWSSVLFRLFFSLKLFPFSRDLSAAFGVSTYEKMKPDIYIQTGEGYGYFFNNFILPTCTESAPMVCKTLW